MTPNNYLGRNTVTVSGRTCQFWNAQTPHKHTMNTKEKFRGDGTVEAAMNYCRDPDNKGFLWCYTTDPNVRWEGCNVNMKGISACVIKREYFDL